MALLQLPKEVFEQIVEEVIGPKRSGWFLRALSHRLVCRKSTALTLQKCTRCTVTTAIAKAKPLQDIETHYDIKVSSMTSFPRA